MLFGLKIEKSEHKVQLRAHSLQIPKPLFKNNF